MSEWISVEEAAKKYNLKKEYIQLWVDMRVIMSYFKDYKTVVNDESLRGFLKTREKGIDPEYVKALEQFCISKSETCLIYAFATKSLKCIGKPNHSEMRYGACGWNKTNGYGI